MIIPHIIAKLKSLIILPPNINKASNAKIVVAVVFIVLDNVSFIDLFNKEKESNFLNFFMFSLTLSYTTTVSFIE
tara:strand:+ start:524 stop:748 length:225 start_codon:yes stop_codon:yes gene_type:complete